ncbi:SPOR domain-containing protein [Vibrionales bacterium C3R12]|nr:SPOR domain-containing protein [Vibrionales bacterium C3R12]
MKKIAIVSLSMLLAACVSENYVTDVTSDSYREEYKTAEVMPPVVSQGVPAMSVTEENVDKNVVKMSPASNTEMNVVQQTPVKQQASVIITPPTKKQAMMNPRFGYTIQVVAVGSQSKVDQFSSKLPRSNQPIWENYKVVNGTKWYTVLYGDYATKLDAKTAIQSLPTEFKQLKPFVKSIDAIKNSEFPTLNKLN